MLFIGLMIDDHDDPYVVDFNVRFGDPSAKTLPARQNRPVQSLLHGAATDAVSATSNWNCTPEGSAGTVVLASEGYPAAPCQRAGPSHRIRGRVWPQPPTGHLLGQRRQWVCRVRRAANSSHPADGSSPARLIGADLQPKPRKTAYALLDPPSTSEGAIIRTDIAHRAMH